MRSVCVAQLQVVGSLKTGKRTYNKGDNISEHFMFKKKLSNKENNYAYLIAVKLIKTQEYNCSLYLDSMGRTEGFRTIEHNYSVNLPITAKAFMNEPL